ncbi:MAG: hypothetical protein NTW32_12885 [Chloroflexi bacterium]|nr:hypothetical protein [Chloroflexota bacterium]
MNKPLNTNELEHLQNFVGYGRLDADIWFLGFEETSGEADKLRNRLKFHQVEDCADAQNTLDISQAQFGEENLQGAWAGICEIMLKLEGINPSQEDIQKYRADHLARNDGATLLCEMMPIPMPTTADWPYEGTITQYESREAYYAEVKPLRIDLLGALINQHLPKMIIGYGQANWSDYQELFHDISLSPSGQFLLGWNANTVVILCDHFSMDTINGKYDDLVALILEHSLSIETAKPVGPIPLSKAELARQKKEAAKRASAAKRKPSAQHNPSDPYCVCAYCLGYESN